MRLNLSRDFFGSPSPHSLHTWAIFITFLIIFLEKLSLDSPLIQLIRMPQSWAHSYLYLILLLIYYSTCSFNLISMHLTISLAGAHYGIWIIVGTLDGFPHHRRASNQCTGTITARECRRSSGSKPCAIYSKLASCGKASAKSFAAGWLEKLRIWYASSSRMKNGHTSYRPFNRGLVWWRTVRCHFLDAWYSVSRGSWRLSRSDRKEMGWWVDFCGHSLHPGAMCRPQPPPRPPLPE